MCAAMLGCNSDNKPNQEAITPTSNPAVASGATSRPTLEFSPDSVNRALAGKQSSTTRQGLRHYTLGPATMKARQRSVPIVITDLKYKKFSDLGDSEAKSDGYSNLDALRTAMKKSYPDIAETDMTTTIYFKVVQN